MSSVYENHFPTKEECAKNLKKLKDTYLFPRSTFFVPHPHAITPP